MSLSMYNQCITQRILAVAFLIVILLPQMVTAIQLPHVETKNHDQEGFLHNGPHNSHSVGHTELDGIHRGHEEHESHAHDHTEEEEEELDWPRPKVVPTSATLPEQLITEKSVYQEDLVMEDKIV